MRELLLDAETLYTRAQAHDALAKAFGFPADYGRTLDALYDLLTACPPARLTLRHAEKLVDNMGNYGELLLRVLADAAAENPRFRPNKSSVRTCGSGRCFHSRLPLYFCAAAAQPSAMMQAAASTASAQALSMAFCSSAVNLPSTQAARS